MTDVSLSMKKISIFSVSACAALMALPACSPGSDQPQNIASNDSGVAENNMVAPMGSAEKADNSAQTAPVSARVLGLEGLGDLHIGKPVPKGSLWAERGAQTNDSCRTVSSPDYPGVYAIVIDGTVQRITVSQRSDVKLAEGIGAGATEKEVGKWFAGFDVEPHKYVDAPAKYLTAPNAQSGDSALMFEIGQDGKVSMIHVGIMPVLAYVEGCS